MTPESEASEYFDLQIPTLQLGNGVSGEGYGDACAAKRNGSGLIACCVSIVAVDCCAVRYPNYVFTSD